MLTTKSKARFTTKEKIKVITEALRLLRKPEYWCKGNYACTLYVEDETGFKIMDADGSWIPRTDTKGRVLYQFCLEGAINTATFNVLGQKRAIALGAINDKYGDPIENPDEYFGGDYGKGNVSDMMSLYGLAIDVIGADTLEYENSGESPVIDFNDDTDTEYPDVMKFLRTKRSQLNAQLRKREKAAA